MKYKTVVVAILVLCLLGLAVFQVQRYFVSKRVNPTDAVKRGLTVETRFEDYDDVELRRSGDSLQSSLYKHVHQALAGLEPGQRPSNEQADLIANAYAQFLVLRRTATREEYLAAATRKPIAGLVDTDTEQADLAWQYNSAWARHAEIPVDTIRVSPICLNGTVVGELQQRGTRATRKLSNNQLFSAETVGRHSVYEVLIDLTVPSIDAADEFKVTLRTMLINDGPRGEWSPVANEFLGIPTGKVVFVPSP